MIHLRRQLRWNDKGLPCCSLPKGDKTWDVPAPPLLLEHIDAALRTFPAVECTLPWSNPKPATTELRERQRRPIAVPLSLATSQRNRIYCRT